MTRFQGVVLHTLLVGEPPLNKDAEETKKIVSSCCRTSSELVHRF